MSHIQKLRYLYKLKEVNRDAMVRERHESTAEHTWSMMMLADYFLGLVEKEGTNLDKARVFELILYHDVPEIETGDINIADEEKRKDKPELEKEAALSISRKIPETLGKKLVEAFDEYEGQKTKESRFAKAMDRMDALMHELDYPKRWKGWGEEKVKRLFGKQVTEFKPVNDAFEEILDYVSKHDYY